MHAYCAGNGRETAKNETESIRTRQMGSRTRNSPNAIEIATPELPSRWKKVSAGGINVYVPQNAPIDATNQIFIFGRVESRGEAIAPSVESERAGNGDGDMGDTTSGGGIDLKRVETVLLAGESQHECQSRRTRDGNSPVSSRPPIHHEERLYIPVRHRR